MHDSLHGDMASDSSFECHSSTAYVRMFANFLRNSARWRFTVLDSNFRRRWYGERKEGFVRRPILTTTLYKFKTLRTTKDMYLSLEMFRMNFLRKKKEILSICMIRVSRHRWSAALRFPCWFLGPVRHKVWHQFSHTPCIDVHISHSSFASPPAASNARLASGPTSLLAFKVTSRSIRGSLLLPN